MEQERSEARMSVIKLKVRPGTVDFHLSGLLFLHNVQHTDAFLEIHKFLQSIGGKIETSGRWECTIVTGISIPNLKIISHETRVLKLLEKLGVCDTEAVMPDSQYKRNFNSSVPRMPQDPRNNAPPWRRARIGNQWGNIPSVSRLKTNTNVEAEDLDSLLEKIRNDVRKHNDERQEALMKEKELQERLRRAAEETTAQKKRQAEAAAAAAANTPEAKEARENEAVNIARGIVKRKLLACIPKEVIARFRADQLNILRINIGSRAGTAVKIAILGLKIESTELQKMSAGEKAFDETALREIQAMLKTKLK